MDGIVYDGKEWLRITHEQAAELVRQNLVVKCHEQDVCRKLLHSRAPVVVYHCTSTWEAVEQAARAAQRRQS